MKKHQNDDDWFWKSNKEKYHKMLKNLSKKDQKRKIEKYDNKVIAKVNWTFFCVRKQNYSFCFMFYQSYDCSKKFILYTIACAL